MAAPLSASSPHQGSQQGSLGFNLGAIALVLALLGVGAAYLIDSAGRSARDQPHRHDNETSLVRNIGGSDLEIPLSWFRYEEQRVEGFAKQIDLTLELPLNADGKLAMVDVTLLPRSRVRPSASLLDGVYLHQFLPDQLTGPPGLVGKPLQAGEGYENETVWYDPLSAAPFVAKCSKPVETSVTAQCLRTVHLGPGLAGVYAFDESVLANWRQFDAAIGERLKRIGAL